MDGISNLIPPHSHDIPIASEMTSGLLPASDKKKINKMKVTIYLKNLTLEAGAWVDNTTATDGSSDYPYRADILIGSSDYPLTSTCTGRLSLNPAAKKVIVDAQTTNGVLKVYTKSLPTEDIVIDCFEYTEIG